MLEGSIMVGKPTYIAFVNTENVNWSTGDLPVRKTENKLKQVLTWNEALEYLI